MKQITIKQNCIRCGTCFSESNFFKEDELGYSTIANSNLVEDVEFEEIKEVIENCPINAIEVIESAEEVHAMEVVRVIEESNREITIDRARKNRRFSLLKMFGNLDLDEIDDPDAISSQILGVIKNKEYNMYRKLERKVRDTIENVLDEDDDYVEMNRSNFYIECQMNVKDHRLQMDRLKLNYYFNISDNVLNISIKENSFEVSIDKAILVKVFLLTALYEKYNEKINYLSHKDIESCANDFISKEFEIFDESKPTPLTIVLGATLAAITSEAAVRAAVETSVEAVVSTARKSWKSEKDVMDKVIQESVIEAAFDTTIKSARESVFNTIINTEDDSTFSTAVELAFNTAIEYASNATIRAVREAAASGRTYSNFIFMNFNFHETAVEAIFNNMTISDTTIRIASDILKKIGYDEAINSTKIAAVDLSRDAAIESAKTAISKI